MWRGAAGRPPPIQSVPAPRWVGPMPAQPASDGSGPKADEPTMPCASGSKHGAPVRRTTTTTGGDRQVGTRSPGMITGAGEHTAPRQDNWLIKDIISHSCHTVAADSV